MRPGEDPNLPLVFICRHKLAKLGVKSLKLAGKCSYYNKYNYIDQVRCSNLFIAL